MNLTLKGKNALVTGGSKGIGLGIARALANAGCNVIITGRNAEGVAAVAKELTTDTVKVMGLAADVRKLEDMRKVADAARTELGNLDVVIANAGVGHFAHITELSMEHWNNMIDTNLTGLFTTIKSTVEMLKETRGYFFTIASLAGTNFFAGGGGYNASKFGAVGFTQAVMLDLRHEGINVSTIMPGSVASYFNSHMPNDEKDLWKIQPEDIGELVIDLLKMNRRALPSKVEIRPARPPKK